MCRRFFPYITWWGLRPVARVLVLLILNVIIGNISSHIRGLRSHMHLKILEIILFILSVLPLDLGKNGLLCIIFIFIRRAVSVHTSAMKFGPQLLINSNGHPWMVRTCLIKPLANSAADVCFGRPGYY